MVKQADQNHQKHNKENVAAQAGLQCSTDWNGQQQLPQAAIPQIKAAAQHPPRLVGAGLPGRPD